MSIQKIAVADEFHHRLVNRDERQGDGQHNAVRFRTQFLSELANRDAWRSKGVFIELDFSNVTKIAPSFANEAFAFFTQFAEPDEVLKKISIVNASTVQREIIKMELKTGYYQRR